MRQYGMHLLEGVRRRRALVRRCRALYDCCRRCQQRRWLSRRRRRQPHPSKNRVKPFRSVLRGLESGSRINAVATMPQTRRRRHVDFLFFFSRRISAHRSHHRSALHLLMMQLAGGRSAPSSRSLLRSRLGSSTYASGQTCDGAWVVQRAPSRGRLRPGTNTSALGLLSGMAAGRSSTAARDEVGQVVASGRLISRYRHSWGTPMSSSAVSASGACSSTRRPLHRLLRRAAKRETYDAGSRGTRLNVARLRARRFSSKQTSSPRNDKRRFTCLTTHSRSAF